METLHTTSYDEQLKNALPHLNVYPQYLPFLGRDWELQQDKLLLVAESHFLPEGCDNRSSCDTWYDGIKLYPDELTHTDTRLVVSRHRNQKGDRKDHPLFVNLEGSIRKTQTLSSTYNFFQSIAYCNYFQRPAEQTGKSIKNTPKDNIVAYEHIKHLKNTAGITHIVFTSRKAYSIFNVHRALDKEQSFTNVAIDCVPHPTSIWWNRKSKSYGDGNSKATGREKFERIMSSVKLKEVG